MKKSLITLLIIAIILPVLHIILSMIFRIIGSEFYGDISTLLKLFIFPLGLTTLLWYLFSAFLGKYLICFLHYLVYRNRNRPESRYFFTKNEYPTSITNYLREAFYPTALFLTILMFILGSGADITNAIFSISFNIINGYFFSVLLIFPALSTVIIAPVKLVNWSGFRYYNSKRNAVFQVGKVIGRLFNSLTGMAVILSFFISFLSVGLEMLLRVTSSILFYILPLNIILIIILKFFILPRKELKFKNGIKNKKKYKITPITQDAEIKIKAVNKNAKENFQSNE
ncbi:MAG: hypothetical protein GF329_06255 [Candidatus Lokiarchaeota archaeon]|nr:hypothetical protein [Candidatus Lokiarchaeota archaeon]